MMPRKLAFVVVIALLSCVRKPEQFSTPAENDTSVIFPLSVGQGFIEVEARKATYELLDGEVLRALMIAANDYIPPGIHNPPCWARIEALTYRFTRREDIIFVYVDENFAYCGQKLRPFHSGAKYAISKDGRILRRVIDGMDADDQVWSLETPDGGRVTVVTGPGVIPDQEDLETPDSGILKIVTEPVNMPGVMVFEPPGEPIPGEPGVIPGVTMLPPDSGYSWEYRDGRLIAVPQEPPPAPSSGPDGGSPDAGWDAGPLSR
ncbi:MAG TPA: hypothetical protein VEY88_20395 [Archangium sp.]|nr:hypothetical protein [Archangium sp.]